MKRYLTAVVAVEGGYEPFATNTPAPEGADLDAAVATADPTWTPLISVNHPEYPSGHGFYSTAVTEAVAALFGTDDVQWTITTSKDSVPQLVRTARTYQTLGALMEDVTDARVWAGLHYRNTMHEGSELGRRVAEHVLDSHFRPRT